MEKPLSGIVILSPVDVEENGKGAGSLEFAFDPPFTEGLRDGMSSLWVEVVNDGGAVVYATPPVSFAQALPEVEKPSMDALRAPMVCSADEAARGREMRFDKRDHSSLALWAADCAERALPYFEEKRPKDDRPRKAIEAGRAWARGEIKMSEARSAAVAAYAVKAAADERDWQHQRLPKNLRPIAFPTRGND